MRNNLDLHRRNHSTWDLFQELDDFLERTFRSEASTAVQHRAPTMNPNIHVEENEQSFLVNVDIPGIKKEDVKIDLQGRTLTISGERRSEERGEGEKTFSRSYGQFSRSFSLPDVVNVEKIEANLQDGVLAITLPKAQTTQSRKIEIGGGTAKTIETQKH